MQQLAVMMAFGSFAVRTESVHQIAVRSGGTRPYAFRGDGAGEAWHRNPDISDTLRCGIPGSAAIAG